MGLLTRSSHTGVFLGDDAATLSRLLDKIIENIQFVKREGAWLLGGSNYAESSLRSLASSTQQSSDEDKYYDANDVMVLDESSDGSLFDYASAAEKYDSHDEDDTSVSERQQSRPLSVSSGGHTCMPIGGYYDNIRNVVVPLPIDVLSFLASLDKLPWPFRTRLPHGMCPITVSVASLFRKSIGKDSSTLSMPICLNEPVNLLQRMCQEFEYAELLNTACLLPDSCHRLLFVAAFACSSYAYTLYRAERKPFNPLLGETFEYISDSKGIPFYLCIYFVSISIFSFSIYWRKSVPQSTRHGMSCSGLH
jgi:hypothetical protein